MNMKKIFYTSLFFLGIGHAMAQQEVMVSQYMFNGLFINPAYAGSHPYWSSSLLHRSQWVDLDGAPTTQLLAIDGPVMDNKMGLGFTLINDQIGVSRDLEFAGNYAYHMQVGQKSRLSLGIKAGLSAYSAKLSDLTYWDQNDQVFQNDISNEIVGKFGAGIYWYSERAFAGLSVPTIYAADKKLSSQIESTTENYFTQHYYLNAGYVFKISETIDLKPSILVKYLPEAPVQADINCNALFRNTLWLGISYRTGDAVVAIVEYQVIPKLRIGYAYDATTSKLNNYSSGSHEIMLGFDFGRDLAKIKSPRYF